MNSISSFPSSSTVMSRAGSGSSATVHGRSQQLIAMGKSQIANASSVATHGPSTHQKKSNNIISLLLSPPNTQPSSSSSISSLDRANVSSSAAFSIPSYQTYQPSFSSSSPSASISVVSKGRVPGGPVWLIITIIYNLLSWI